MNSLQLLKKLHAQQHPTESEWHTVAPQLIQHYLAGYIFVHHQTILPLDLSLQFEQIYERQVLQNHLLLEELSRLEKKIFTSGIPPFIRLKGTSLIGMIYQNPGERHLTDADIFINHQYKHELEKFLESEGYQELSQIKWEANSFKSTFYKTSKLGFTFGLDVHDQLLWRQNRAFKPTALKATSETSSSAHSFVLHPTDLYCHLIANWAYQDTFISLNKLLDIYLLKKQLIAAPDQQRIQQILNLNGLKPAESFVTKALSYIDANSKTKNHQLLSEDFLSNPQAHKLKYILLKHLCKKNIWQAIEYDWQWFLAYGRLWPQPQVKAHRQQQ